MLSLHGWIRFRRPFFYGACAVLIAALLLGGGTRPGFASDLLLQLIALPLLAASLWHLMASPYDRLPLAPLSFFAALLAVHFLQLVPLPPALWAQLPQRQAQVEVFQLLGSELPWRPLSIRPASTWSSALSLVVPLTIFLAVIQLDNRERRELTMIILGVAAITVFLGLSQISFGPAAAIRFYEFTNMREATGFFANRNHLAAFLYCSFLFAAAWAIEASLAAQPWHRRMPTETIVSIAAAVTIMISLIAAQAMTRSRGGLALGSLAILGAFAMTLVDRRRASGITPAKLLGAAIIVGVVLAAQFALYRISQRLGIDPLQNARVVIGRTTVEAAHTLMPWGSGIGTFVPMYALFEKPSDLVANTFANRAHNDFLEFWLECGVIAPLFFLAFAAWFSRSASTAWLHRSDHGAPIDAALTRACSLVILLLLAHSFIDYPLRTAAMGAIFALACAFLIPPIIDSNEDHRECAHQAARRTASPPSRQSVRAAPVPAAWKGDRGWPDEWK